MYQKILLVDLRENSDKVFVNAFRDSGCQVLSCLQEISEINSQLNMDPAVGMVAVYARKPSFDLFNVVAKVINEHAIPLIMFVDSSTRQFTTEAANIGIAAYIVDGFVPGRVKYIIDLARARWQDTQTTRKELEKTRLSLAERKIIEKAKGILMKRRTIDEQAAFQMMRKLAMDKNQKLADVAKNIIHADTLFN